MKFRVKRILFVAIILLSLIGSAIFFVTSQGEKPKEPEEPKDPVVEPENEFAVVSYYHKDLLTDYEAYKAENSDLSIENIVTYVNMGIDKPFYSEAAIKVDNPHALDVLVNKVYSLPEDFVPDDLVLVDGYRGQKMTQEAANAFQALNDECEKNGFTIYAYSGYRSIEWQDEIYNNMIRVYGQEHTDTVSSRPTHSEHHTGLAMDVSIDGTTYTDAHLSPHYDTFYDLLDDYGFILRYPEGKQNITGYSYESWHIRYLGVDLAKKVLKSGLTYDEYVARQ